MYQMNGDGRLVRNGNLREVNVNGAKVPVLDIDLATNDGWGKNRVTAYVRISIWRDAAQKLAPSMVKGRAISFRGTPLPESYQGSDGNTYNRIVLKGAQIGFVDKKPEDPKEVTTEVEVEPDTEPVAEDTAEPAATAAPTEA